LFGRSPNPDQKPLETPKPFNMAPQPAMQVAPAAAPGPSPFAAAAKMTASVIGTDLTIIGEKITIISKHHLQIDGDVRGDVNGVSVVVGEEGSVIGTLAAETVEVRGGVRGAIQAKTVVLHGTAQVEGDLIHNSLSIAEGAHFDGRVRRAKEGELNVVLDPNAFAPAAKS
jgi:cytoskeletal protein CcmA (bactofilin family)